LKAEFEGTEITQTVSLEKVAQFQVSSTKIIKRKLRAYQKLLGNVSRIDDNFSEWRFPGDKRVLDKDTFAEDSKISHLDFDSAFGRYLAEELTKQITATFKAVAFKEFLFKPEELFKALTRLNLTNDHVLVFAGIGTQYYIEHGHISGLTNHKYMDSHIHYLRKFDRPNSVFVLKRTDLPQMIFEQPTDDVRNKFNLNLYSESIKLYGSVVDFNTAPDLLNEYAKTIDRVGLRKSVLQSLELSIKIRWKKDAKVLQFTEYSEYLQGGLPSDLEEVKDFSKN
jgi:hypothetical protein